MLIEFEVSMYTPRRNLFRKIFLGEWQIRGNIGLYLGKPFSLSQMANYISECQKDQRSIGMFVPIREGRIGFVSKVDDLRLVKRFSSEMIHEGQRILISPKERLLIYSSSLNGYEAVGLRVIGHLEEASGIGRYI